MTVPLSLKVRMQKAEVIETLLYGCLALTLRAEHFAKLRRPHHQVLLRVISLQRQLSTDHATLSGANALKMTPCGSIETIIREQQLFFAGGVARQIKERLPSRLRFATMGSGENPRPGGQIKSWNRCMVDNFRELRTTEGSRAFPPGCRSRYRALVQSSVKREEVAPVGT